MNNNNNNNNNSGETRNNRANIIPHDSNMRGYSVENSFYDSPYNMDFEYGYLNLMFNITAFTARTQDMFQSLESNLSSIIELQNERRRLESESRQAREAREARETRETRENSRNLNIPQPATQPVTQPVQENRQNISPNIPNTRVNDNLNYLLGRRNIFDTSNNILFSFLPRNVLLNPTTLTDTIGGRTNRRNINGLTIQEIEDNTEIISYGSIAIRRGLNTECPISRDTFNDNSVVLRLKECGHCFIPFRMMTWLESHSTCPLCRSSVVAAATPTPTPAAAAAAPATAPTPAAATNTFSDILNNIRSNTNLDNLSIDNMNDESIVFSFDLPRSVNDDTQGREFTNTYLSSLSQIFSNLNRNTANASNTSTNDSTNNNETHSEPEHEYDEVD
jgi:hypothetical protein